MKRLGVLVWKFELTPKGLQSGHGSSFIWPLKDTTWNGISSVTSHHSGNLPVLVDCTWEFTGNWTKWKWVEHSFISSVQPKSTLTELKNSGILSWTPEVRPESLIYTLMRDKEYPRPSFMWVPWTAEGHCKVAGWSLHWASSLIAPPPVNNLYHYVERGRKEPLWLVNLQSSSAGPPTSHKLMV